MANKVKLQLGDIIEIVAPNDTDINNKTYYIGYIDADKIRLEEADGNETLLTLTNGSLDNESIESILIKSRAEEEGYARQNNLIIGVWIDLFFGGDLPLTITGKITNLDEDKIEITTFPEKEVIFLDFAYKGLPEDLPIEKIQIRRAPEVDVEQAQALVGEQQSQAEQGQAEQTEGEEMTLEEMEKKHRELMQQLIEIPEEEEVDVALEASAKKKVQEEIRTIIFTADQIKFGDEDLEAITQFVDVPEDEQRYDIDKQLDDLLDDMLSTVPNAQRSDTVKNNIHKMIQRFQQLRDTFSIFDDKGYALMPKAQGANYKPLVEVMEKLEKQLYWLLPVVKESKKLYETKEQEELNENDYTQVDFDEVMKQMDDIQKRYETNDTGNESNKYVFLQKELNTFQTPFTDPLRSDHNEILIKGKVNSTITAVVDNLDNFNSSVHGHDTYSHPNSNSKRDKKRPLSQKRFALQTFTTGATGLEMMKMRGENPIIKRKNITPNETMNVTSLLTLPEPTVRFARVNLMATNLLEKSNLNMHFLNYWQLLRENTHVSKTTITDLTKPYNHDPERFLKDVKQFSVESELLYEDASSAEANDSYNKFLETVIPKTKFLFNLIKPYLVGKLSITDILTYLEPFMIYQADLTYMQYKEMHEYIQEKIVEYRKRYATKAREYGNMKGTQLVSMPSLIKILDENANLRAKVLDVYGFTDTIMQMTNADFIKHILEVDMGVFYNNAIALISVNLMMADGSRDITDINGYLNAADQAAQKKATAAAAAETKGKTKGKQTKKSIAAQAAEAAEANATIAFGDQAICNKIKVIAKRYIELDELTEDNGKVEVYFDKKYDTTPYDIGEKFKADKNLTLNEQIQHYIARITKNKGMDEINAKREAEAIIKGKRLVAEGEYAILETTDETSATLQYYVRNNDIWILDDTIDPETLADDMNMLCNLNEKCIAVKDTCQDQTTGANELKKQNLKLLLAEFENNLTVNKDIVGSRIDDEFASADGRMDILKQLQFMQLYKYETKKIALANSLEAGVEVITSPYAGLLSNIIGQSDVSKRYLDITKFVIAFTREGLVENSESPYWLYCVKTNQKLLPTFIHKLAYTFVNGGDFLNMLNRICSEQGKLSDDGDKWVDEHSGQTIKMIELNADEEYNEEGFKIVTRSVMEMDAGELVMQAAMSVGTNVVGANTLAPGNAPGSGAPRKYATPDATKIYNVIDTMCTNMGIILEDQKDFIVRNTLKQISNTSVMPSKAAYDKLLTMSATKGKTMDTYENAFNSTLLYLTLAYYLIAIQISIPPIKTKTTFPGCKKAFIGFPVDGTDSMKGLNYVACVAQKMKNVAALPWSSIANRNATFIAKQIEINITKYILPTEDVQNGIKEVKLYLSANPDLDVPAEHNVTNWQNFLPPLKALKIGSIQDVGDVFKSRLSDSLKKGSGDQQDYILEVQSKMMAFSFNIIDLIEKTIRGEQAILRSNGGEPFVENACCEVGENNTIMYFVKKQPEIAILNNKVVRLSDIFDDTMLMSKAALLYDPRNTKRLLREVDQNFSEETIYQAFIVYCKFNSFVPLSENLKAICPTKPDDFDMNDSLEESIRKLKSNARNYNESSLQQLLEVINNSTKQPIPHIEKKITNEERLNAILVKLDEENSRPSLFRDAFTDVLNHFEINALMEDNAEMRKFKNILAKLNEDMEKQVMEFVSSYGVNIKGESLRNFRNCLSTIMQFKETGDNLFLGKKEETGYKMINFMKKTMRCLTKEFPNIILNKINYENGTTVPKHWLLSQKHQSDVKEIIKKHYVELNGFYDDAQINMMMEKLKTSGEDMNELAQNTLFYSPVEMKSKHITNSGKKSSGTGIELVTPAMAMAEEEERKTGQKAPIQGAPAPTQGVHTQAAHTQGANKKDKTYKYSAFDLDLTSALFKFYFFSILTDLVALQADKDILHLPLLKLQESSSTDEDEDLFMSKAVEMEVLVGNQAELAEKICNIIVCFTNLICKDKSAIDYNYKSLMELIMRSKEKEKDEITDYLKNMTVEEREVENLFKGSKLGRWSKGEQKGIRIYDKDTYDEERGEMEQMALREAQLNKRSVVTDMNRDIFSLEMLSSDLSDEQIDREDNVITYMGEDAEPEDYGMDGDENF